MKQPPLYWLFEGGEMFVCLCKAVTADKLRNSKHKNTQKTAHDTCKSLGVGSDCGMCLNQAMSILEELEKHGPKAGRKKE